MKYISILFLFLVFTLHTIAQEATSWQQIYPYPTGSLLLGVFAQNEDTVIAVGSYGTIIKTTDGGERWSIQQNAGAVAGVSLYSVKFSSDVVGYVVGTLGTILKTTDGGDTWIQQSSGTTSTLYGVSFVNDTVGFAVGGTSFTITGYPDWTLYKDPVVLRTTNGGKIWVSLPFPFFSGLKSVVFRDALNGIVAGDSLSVFRTSDGGITWDRVLSSSTVANSNKSVCYAGNNTYFTIGSGDVHRSTDDGLTWELLPYPPVDENPFRDQYAISFFDSTHGVTSGRWYLYGTSNAGVSWTSTYNYGMHIWDIHMVDSLTAFAAGYYGTLLKTTDGGVSWTVLSGSPKPVNIYGVHFTDANNGLAAGMNAVLRTTDGGNTWNPHSIPVSTDYIFRDIYFPDNRTGYLVGETSVPGPDTCIYLKTTDGGDHWFQLNKPPTAADQAVHFVDSLNGTVVGDTGNFPNFAWTVIHTTDGGVTWSWQDTPLSDSVNGWPWGLYFSDVDHGTIVGTSNSGSTPAILHTIDGGVNWVRQSCPVVKGILRDVYFSDNINGMIVGSEYNVNNKAVPLLLKTTDGGTNWIKQSHPYDTLQGRSFTKMYSINSNIIFLNGSMGNLYTTDGGLTWTKQSSPIGGYLGMDFIKIGNGWKGYGSYLGIATTTIGELPAKYWDGNVDSSWDNPNNWDPVGVPTSGDSVVIRPNGTSPVIFMPKTQITIAALTIIGAGRLTITDALAQLVVLGNVDIRGTLKVRQGARTRFLCGGKWKNKPGSLYKSFAETDEGFVPANSTVYFNGQGDFQGNFYNLVFDTTAIMETAGNVVVENNCTILKTLSLRPQDTLFVSSTEPQALYGNGIINKGTVKRYINPDMTEPYQFESKYSYVQFDNQGTKPTSVAMQVFPETTATNWGEVWEEVQSTIDTANNTIMASGIQEFSKWSLGIPRPTGTSPSVNRVYAITAQGGQNFAAQLSLRFDPSEMEQGTSKDSLRLLRLLGTYATNSMQEKWNMISLPVERKRDELRMKDSLFNSSISDAFAFFPSSGYIQKDTLEYGVGYWLKFPAAETIKVLGEKRDEAKILVEPGWNMIGTLSTLINTSSVTSEPAGIIASEFFGYQSGYLNASVLEPMKAYWVKVSSEGFLKMQTFTNTNKQSGINQATLQLQKVNPLSMNDATGNSQELYYTGKSSDVVKHVSNEFPPPPPIGAFDVRYKSQRFIERPDNDKPKVVPIIFSSVTYPLTIRWEPKEKNISAWLLVDGKEFSLSVKGSVTISKPETPVKIKFASSNDNIPKAFALEQNHPNPFNPSTVIRYQLPVDSRVTLKIFNVLGQEIETLVDEIQDAGYISKEWNASGVASGVYFYKIEATSISDNAKSYRHMRKMLLLR
ncbi:MAG: T9SS type A sorting domain-containing protein [Ignavibacteriae bacterium]|nr:T9SS type A sorting domain-containing protein [Ignavibacteriota bacterium]